jgi:IS5 family transposase
MTPPQAKKGQIVDASFVHVPKQRNSREENQRIKEGEGEAVKKEWEEEKPAKARQKDIDARWTKKNKVSHFGYKNHVMVDNGGKFIRDYAVTDASVHDSNHFTELLDKESEDRNVYADSAYMSAKHLEDLQELEFVERLCRKGSRGHALSEEEKANNREKSRSRCRVEHVFGVMLKRAGDLTLRCIGIIRAENMTGLRNLAYNITRYTILAPAMVK